MSVRTERSEGIMSLRKETRKKKEATNFNRMKFRDIIVYLIQGYYCTVYVYTYIMH